MGMCFDFFSSLSWLTDIVNLGSLDDILTLYFHNEGFNISSLKKIASSATSVLTFA